MTSPVLLSLILTPAILARGDGTFQAPLVLPNAGRPGPATVHAGDLNGDGKIDLVTANGSPRIIVYFQSPTSREAWKSLPLPVGAQVWFVRAADFTGDGRDDIIASDVSATAYFIQSLPGDAFKQPVPISEAKGSRWTAVGDWNRDGKLDFATANISAADITVFLGDGTGGFTLSQRLAGSREHALEALDYDGDGILDLVLGTGLTGLTPHKGVGDGTFLVKEAFDHMGCTEYLAEVGHYEGSQYVQWGDLNGDGRGDLAPTCLETTSAAVGISRGDGTYEKTFETLAGPDVDSTAFADLNRDGKTDLALVSRGSTSLLVQLGKGDGHFELDPIVFGPTGDTPVFLIARDLDRDGRIDLVSADQLSSTLTLFWGREGERFLESAATVSGFAGAKSMAIGDLDQNGMPDFFFPRSDRPETQVYLNPGSSSVSTSSLTIPSEEKFPLLAAQDLDGDRIPDLAGADPVSGKALVALLDAQGKPRSQQSLDAGVSPASLSIESIDDGATPDIIVPCKGSNHLAIFYGQGNGSFSPASILPTIAKPKAVLVADWDADSRTDLVVLSDTALAIHSGNGSASFDVPESILTDASRLFTGIQVGDLDADGRLDLAVTESRSLAVMLFRGKAPRGFESPLSIKVDGAPGSLAIADLDGDARLDITTSSPSARSASVLLQRDDLEFVGRVYGLGIVPSGHNVADLDLDGALDIVAFSASGATVLAGRPAMEPERFFRRGDASGDGNIAINDPILILAWLFQGGVSLGCDDAADADDNGALNLGDPITVLRYLFLGDAPPAPPGPDDCGADPTSGDALTCESGCV